MNADECRKRALQCQQQAARSWGTLQLDFMTAAETWLQLALDFDRLAERPVAILAKVKEDFGETDSACYLIPRRPEFGS
jgi:hypothetical protein